MDRTFYQNNAIYSYGPIGIFNSRYAAAIHQILKCMPYDDSIDHGLIYGTNPEFAAAYGGPLMIIDVNYDISWTLAASIVYTNAAYPPRVSTTVVGAIFNIVGTNYANWSNAPIVHNYYKAGVYIDRTDFADQGSVTVGVNGSVFVGTRYLIPGFVEDTDENVAAFVSPKNMRIGQLYISARVAPSAGKTYTINVRINGVTRITLALSGTNTSASSASTYYLAAGQRVTFQAVANAGCLA